ncbi:MAG: TrmH family RNA methyltransferase [Candidatus Saccharimonadales bacterium]
MHITLVAHNIRSTHNVGAFFRTCDALGVQKIIFSGYTPYPTFEGDSRMPHFADRITRQIHKTALGAESTVAFACYSELEDALADLRTKNATLVALEQFPGSITPEECKQKLETNHADNTVALIVGNEIHGVADTTLQQMDFIIEIPMHGTKESLNVSVATGIALYTLSR